MTMFLKGAAVASFGLLYLITLSACAPNNYDPTYLGVKKVMEQRQ